MDRYLAQAQRRDRLHCLTPHPLPGPALYHAPLTDDAFPQETGLPPSWEVRHSNSKNLPYYFNAAEKTSRWEPPQGTDVDKLKHYMAKYHSGSGVAEGGSAAQPGKIRAAHLLVKHEESRRPSSWREVSATRFLLPSPSRRAELAGTHLWRRKWETP